MKKAIVWILSLVLIIGMAVPAYAADTAAQKQSKAFLVSSTAKDSKCAFLNEADALTEDELASLTDAQKEELEAAEKGMDKRDLFYFSTSEPTTAVFRVPDIRNLTVKQFIDGKWVTLKSTINADGTITVENAVSAPMMIFAVPKNKVASPTAPQESTTVTSLLPVFVSSTSDDCALYSVLEGYKLSADARQAFEDAQNSLKDALPEGMAARYFFYVYTSEPCTLVLRISNFKELVVKQYIDGKWQELACTVNAGGTVTIENVVEGPMAIFTA